MPVDSTSTQAKAEVLWRFGNFVLWESQRRLELRGQSIRLGSRSFDMLLTLLKHAGDILSNEELLASVWRGVVVGDISVRVHMSNLRKALGAPGPEDGCREWITNIPLRGYRFVGRVECEAAHLLGGIAPRRLVTVIDSGIEKTGIAITVTGKHQAPGAGLVCFVDLAPRSDLVHALAERLVDRDLLLLAGNGAPAGHVLAVHQPEAGEGAGAEDAGALPRGTARERTTL